MHYQGIVGIFAFIAIAWLISENRGLFRLRVILSGLVAQLILAVMLLKIPAFKAVFLLLNKMVIALETATTAGTSFVFGYLGGGTLPFDEKYPGSSFVLGLQALPLVLVVSALTALLFYWRIIPYIVKAFSLLLEKTMAIGGALGLGASANIFVGMIESPLFIRPYLKDMTRSELFAIMTCGMATIAGTVMVLYATILNTIIPDAMGHILTASIISAIIALLIVLVALVTLSNLILGLFPDFGGQPVTLQRLLGYCMAPVVWLMGIPWSEATAAGSLMGTKTILNEFIAYIELSKLPEETMSQHSRLIMTYALCGFANFGSLGIMIGGLRSMVPERQDEIVALGLKSIVAGTLATCMTGAIVGIF
jgi:CNT family concentrative nucleoside transporter